MRVFKANHRCSKAFTIMEAMIAILLIGIMMAGGMAFYNLATRHAGESAHEKIALALAQSKMEDVRSSAPASSGPMNVTIGHLPGTMDTYWDPSTRTYDVVVTWHEPEDDPAKDRNVVLTTYVAN